MPIILLRLKCNFNFVDRVWKISHISNIMKVPAVKAELLLEDGSMG